MAVYTPVTRAELEAFLEAYDLGTVAGFAGVEQGVENTNYILSTTRGRFVLTLFEKRVAEADLPFFAAAMAHMSARGVPAPSPIGDRTGRVFRTLNGRPAALFTYLQGRQRMTPSAEDCRAMGALNAHLHLASSDFSLTRRNGMSLDAWRALAEKCCPVADKASPGLAELIANELTFLEANWPAELPTGLVHADLFPDNVFFDGDALSGVIDFYFACTDFFVYDLALTLNAWAAPGRPWNEAAAIALLAGYESERALLPEEKAGLPVCLRGASLRILLTRLHDWLHRVEGATVAVKDPLEYRDLLLLHRARSAPDLFG